MSIKLYTRIKLPFIIRLEEPKLYELNLKECEKFSTFKVTFNPNTDEIADELYNSEYPDNICLYIEIEAVSKKFNYETYDVDRDIIYTTYKVPYKDRIIIFNKIKEKLDKLFKYIQYRTKMFWIDELPINPLSGVIGVRTDFAFMHPEQKIRSSAKHWTTIYDNFMIDLESNALKPLCEELISEYESLYLADVLSVDYLFKANKSMYESEYISFIIYCAISAESYIKSFVSLYETEEDIVLKRLIEVGRNNMVETYYKVILKYLLGKSLLEIDQSLYNNLVTIFKLRNDIMHKGLLDTESLIKVGLTELNFENCSKIIDKLEKAMRIMHALKYPKITNN